jgi:hypothetical protein
MTAAAAQAIPPEQPLTQSFSGRSQNSPHGNRRFPKRFKPLKRDQIIPEYTQIQYYLLLINSAPASALFLPTINNRIPTQTVYKFTDMEAAP